MHAIVVRGRRFSGYAVMLYVGLVVALVVADGVARREGLDPRRVVVAGALLIPVLLAGARGLAVLLAREHFRAHPRELARMEHGGAAMLGGLPPALLVAVPLLWWLELPYGSFWDVAAVAILAGMIPTRLGCLSSGCCAGRPTSSWLGLSLRSSRGVRARRIPSPLLEAALAAALLVVVGIVRDVLPFPGAAFLLALGGYSGGRVLLEGLRERRGPLVAGLGAHQWISLALLVGCAVALTAGWMRVVPGEALATRVGPAGTAHLVASALLLLPVIVLFRFLGCDLVFPLELPTHVVQLGAVVPPAAPPAEYTATIALVGSSGEVGGSPFELPPKPPLPDGSLVFETTVEVAQGEYVASCVVLHPALIGRLGSCTGNLNTAGLAVIFIATVASAPNVIDPFRCFEPFTPPS